MVMERGHREAAAEEEEDAAVWVVPTPLVRAESAYVRSAAVGRRMRPGSRATRRRVRIVVPG